MDRKERLREKLDKNPWLEDDYEAEMIEKSPSKLRALGRNVMDALGLKSVASEKMRDREAMAVVLREYREEKEQRRFETLKYEEKRREEAQRRERERAEWEADLERRALEGHMSTARGIFERRKQERFENQRAQELVEKELNARLTTVDALEEAVLSEEEGVSKRSVEFAGAEIPVYDLTGKPFEMVSHAVDYRYSAVMEQRSVRGRETAEEVVAHPELWARTREEVEGLESFGTDSNEAVGDTISTSYVNSERNLDTRVATISVEGHPLYYTLCYGFEQLPADSLIFATNRDGGATNACGKGETSIGKYDANTVEMLQASGGAKMYNELLLRRYDESGEPLKPSYIIAEDGHITEAAMRHAKYFGVPIVNIERAPYEKKLRAAAIEAIDTVGPESSYKEIDEVITTLKRAPEYYEKFERIESVGRGRDVVSAEAAKERLAVLGPLGEKLARLEDLEFEKRMKLIEAALVAGPKEGDSKPAGFDYFTVLDYPVKGSQYEAPGGCDYLSVQFTLPGGMRRVETTIYNGEEMVDLEKAIEAGIVRKEWPAGDSTWYRRLKPLVDEYIRKRGY